MKVTGEKRTARAAAEEMKQELRRTKGGKKFHGGARTTMPRAGEVKITDAQGNVRYEKPLSYSERRVIAGTGRNRLGYGLKQRIRERDQVCQQCGTDVGPFHVDHIRPYSKGGWNVESNLQLLCAPCNYRKGATWSKPSLG